MWALWANFWLKSFILLIIYLLVYFHIHNSELRVKIKNILYDWLNFHLSFVFWLQKCSKCSLLNVWKIEKAEKKKLHHNLFIQKRPLYAFCFISFQVILNSLYSYFWKERYRKTITRIFAMTGASLTCALSPFWGSFYLWQVWLGIKSFS